MHEEIVNGLDTIQDLASKPSIKSIKIPYNIEYTQTVLQQGWNACYVAIIPYCMICKKPLVWHRHPEGEVLFHCNNCNINWIKGEGWDKHHVEK